MDYNGKKRKRGEKEGEKEREKKIKNVELKNQKKKIYLEYPEKDIIFMLINILNDFLIKDSTIGHDKILIFTTVANINYLNQSFIWIMDGTFKTVPIIFKQLYTIHGCVGGN